MRLPSKETQEMDLLASILAGDSGVLKRLGGGFPAIYLPNAEPAGSPQELDAALAELGWPGRRIEKVRPVAVTKADSWAAEEVEVLISPGSGRDGIVLPVACVIDTRHPKPPQIRVYYSNWPLSQRHRVRAPLVAAGDIVPPDDFVGAYHKALRAGALTAIVETFEPDGVAREPAGGAHAYRGAERLARFYAHLCGEDIGIVLEYCTLFDDGARCVLEYNCLNWAGTSIPPQAGVAVYQRGKSGRLAAARIYDDVDPPMD